MRVFLGTNVLVSAYATRGLCAEVVRVVLAEHELVLGEVVLDELERVLVEKIRLPRADVAEIVAFLREHPVQPRCEALGSVLGSIEVRDPDDALVPAAAVEASADVLVTGDPDLLDLLDGDSAVRDLDVVSPRGFWELIRRRGRDREGS